jgi:hypothetical protein
MPTTGENNKGSESGGGGSSFSAPAPAHAVDAVAADTNIIDTPIDTVKIDPITALQDDIDDLSLAMFEGLRGLRDAVAPESGNLAGEGNPNDATATDENNNTENNGNEPNTNTAELWLAYQRGDPSTVKLMQSIVSGANNNSTASTTTPPGTTTSVPPMTASQRALLPKNAEDFARLYNTKMEVEKDTQLVMKLAGTVLARSRQIDKRVDDYLTVNRTRTRDQQMARIQELLIQNQQVTVELEQAHLTAKTRRDICRQFIRDNTCAALGLEQIND